MWCQVVIGDHNNLVQGETVLEEKTLDLAEIIVHEEYTGKVIENDIALIELAEEVDISVYNPVCRHKHQPIQRTLKAIGSGKETVLFSCE